ALYRQESRLSELSAAYEKDLAGHESDPIRVWRLARVRAVEGNLGGAEDVLQSCLGKNPGNILLLSALADVAAQSKQFGKVRDLARELVLAEPARREHRKRLGVACLELELLGEAAAAFAAYAIGPSERAEVARLYEKRNLLEEAARYYRLALEKNPDAALSRALVEVLVSLGRMDPAEEQARRC